MGERIKQSNSRNEEPEPTSDAQRPRKPKWGGPGGLWKTKGPNGGGRETKWGPSSGSLAGRKTQNGKPEGGRGGTHVGERVENHGVETSRKLVVVPGGYAPPGARRGKNHGNKEDPPRLARNRKRGGSISGEMNKFGARPSKNHGKRIRGAQSGHVHQRFKFGTGPTKVGKLTRNPRGSSGMSTKTGPEFARGRKMQRNSHKTGGFPSSGGKKNNP